LKTIFITSTISHCLALTYIAAKKLKTIANQVD